MTRSLSAPVALTRALVTTYAACCSLVAAAQGAESLTTEEIASGVFVHAGVQEDPSPANLGAIANVGFIVGEKCVAVIDTGGSLKVGQALRSAARKVTGKPICYVINTHVHPDHIFGNAAFKPDKPKFVGHAKLPAAMAARGQNYSRALLRDMGEAGVGSEVIPPDTLVSDRQELDLGGRILTLQAWKTAHTDNDLTVYDGKTGTLWLSDLLFVGRIPVVDGSLRGWLAIMEELKGFKANHVIPGHGMVDAPWPQALESQERYLQLLAQEVRAAIKKRLTLQQAVDTVGLGERDRWLLFEGFHRRNVTVAYAELEWED